MNWRAKSLIQNLVSTLPPRLGDPVYHAVQGARGLRPDTGQQLAFLTRMAQSIERLQGRSVEGGRFVELGSGWFPVTPLFLMACGAASVETFDVSRHYSAQRICLAAAALQKAVAGLAGHPVLTGAEQTGKLPEGIRYHHTVPLQEFTHLAPGSIDTAFSNAVLAYIPPHIIERIHRRSLEWMKDDGLWVHMVSCSDMRAYQDPGLHAVDFLRYSDEEWAKIGNNRFTFHNRLRRPQYFDLFRSAGWYVHETGADIPEQTLATLHRVPVHAQFQRFSPEDLVAGALWFVLGRPPHPSRTGIDRGRFPVA
ncbi:MAG: hypothetical protein SFV51_30520 [Bryobacteraceae bacterium]|nr:hypothetical protein [Bryobacteraceae bacterium]